MSDAKKRIKEAEEKRAELLAKRDAEEAEQTATDLEARFELEVEHGPCAEVKMPVFKKGNPTRAYVRTPTKGEYKRFKDLCNRYEKQPAKVQEAIDQLAEGAWVYPASEEARESMLDAYPGLLTSISLVAAELAQGSKAEEGKG